MSRFFDLRPSELRRVGIMVALLFFLLAANNVIKVVRDSLFLSHFLVSDLSYVYLLVALLAGGIIAVYTRYTAGLPFHQLILGSHEFACTIAGNRKTTCSKFLASVLRQ